MSSMTSNRDEYIQRLKKLSRGERMEDLSDHRVQRGEPHKNKKKYDRKKGWSDELD